MSAHLVPLKVWVSEEAKARGVTMHVVYTHIYRGKYPHLVFKRSNKKAVFVDVEASNDCPGLGPHNDWL